MNKTARRLAVVFILLGTGISSLTHAQEPREHSYVPVAGFVPDDKTAIRIAVAILRPIYGDKVVLAQKPFVATLTDDTWTITGTLPRDAKGGGRNSRALEKVSADFEGVPRKIVKFKRAIFENMAPSSDWIAPAS